MSLYPFGKMEGVVQVENYDDRTIWTTFNGVSSENHASGASVSQTKIDESLELAMKYYFSRYNATGGEAKTSGYSNASSTFMDPAHGVRTSWDESVSGFTTADASNIKEPKKRGCSGSGGISKTEGITLTTKTKQRDSYSRFDTPPLTQYPISTNTSSHGSVEMELSSSAVARYMDGDKLLGWGASANTHISSTVKLGPNVVRYGEIYLRAAGAITMPMDWTGGEDLVYHKSECVIETIDGLDFAVYKQGRFDAELDSAPTGAGYSGGASSQTITLGSTSVSMQEIYAITYTLEDDPDNRNRLATDYWKDANYTLDASLANNLTYYTYS
jgi:hypothetical protein